MSPVPLPLATVDDLARARDLKLALDLIEQLEPWYTQRAEEVSLLWPCRHCKAQVGEACRRPSGEPSIYFGEPTVHSVRGHLGCRAKNSLMLKSHRSDLRDGVRPRQVVEAIQRGTLYKRLVALDRITPPLVRVC